MDWSMTHQAKGVQCVFPPDTALEDLYGTSHLNNGKKRGFWREFFSSLYNYHRSTYDNVGGEDEDEDSLVSLLQKLSTSHILGGDGVNQLAVGNGGYNGEVHVTQPSYSRPPTPSCSKIHQSNEETNKNVQSPPPLISKENNTDEAYWQMSKNGIRERNGAMCANELLSDIHFRVGPNGNEREFPAHKYVLAIGSSVFYAMFFGDLAEREEMIRVPDVEPSAFYKMLKYIYADEIDLDEDSVLPTLQVAKKYLIPQLSRACIQFLEASLTARNACVLLSQARIFDELELLQRCWEVIDAQGELALSSEGFLEIDYSTFSSILSRETLNCKELSIFNAAISWATAECERKEIEPTPNNIRAVLGKSLDLIRVPAMDLREFADGPAQTEVYTLKESHDFFLFFTSSSKPKVSCITEPRKGLTPQICHRFQSSAYRNNQWRYRGRCDSIQFCVDRRVFIIGYGFYGSSNGSAKYSVRIELKHDKTILGENTTEYFSDGSSSTFHVYFKSPVQIDPDAYYTASAVIEGRDLSYFGQEGMTDITVGHVTFQFQCSSESTNGTGVQGGQIPELIFYGPSEPLPPRKNANISQINH